MVHGMYQPHAFVRSRHDTQKEAKQGSAEYVFANVNMSLLVCTSELFVICCVNHVFVNKQPEGSASSSTAPTAPITLSARVYIRLRVCISVSVSVPETFIFVVFFFVSVSVSQCLFLCLKHSFLLWCWLCSVRSIECLCR